MGCLVRTLYLALSFVCDICSSSPHILVLALDVVLLLRISALYNNNKLGKFPILIVTTF